MPPLLRMFALWRWRWIVKGTLARFRETHVNTFGRTWASMLGKILLRFKKTHERSWRAYLKAAERLSLEKAHERLVQSLIIAEAAKRQKRVCPGTGVVDARPRKPAEVGFVLNARPFGSTRETMRWNYGGT